jgi:hypothetical protein
MNIGEWVRSNQPTSEQIAIAKELNNRGMETFTDAVFAMGQDALTFIASSIADPIAGLAGIGLSSFNGVIQGTDTINNVRSALSYVPKTRQNPLNYVLPDSFKQNVGQFAKDITGQDVGKFGLEMAPITGEIMSGKAAIDSIKNPPRADDFIVNGQFNDRAYNKAMQSHGAEIGLNAMGAIPLAGAAVRGAQRLPDLAKVIGNDALRPNMVNQAGAVGVKGDLPMDEASRMKRELEFGGNQVYFHGSPDARNILKDGFSKQGSSGIGGEKPLFFSKDKRLANTYADDSRAYDYQNAEPAVLPVKLNMKNPKTIEWGGKPYRWSEDVDVSPELKARMDAAESDVLIKKDIWSKSFNKSDKDAYIKSRNSRDDILKEMPSKKETSLHDEIDIAKAEGHDGVIVNRIRDNYNTGGPPSNVTVVFEPSQVRSPGAKFDPKKKNSANLLAGGLIGAVGVNAALNGDKPPQQ